MSGPQLRSLADDHGIRATLFSAKSPKRKRRFVWPILIGFLSAFALFSIVVLRAWLLPGYNDKYGDAPLLGHLEFERSLKEQSFSLGSFSVAFTKEQGGPSLRDPRGRSTTSDLGKCARNVFRRGRIWT